MRALILRHSNRIRHFAAVLSVACAAAAFAAVDAPALLAEGEQAWARGDAAGAFRRWENAAARFAKKRDAAGQSKAVLLQIRACNVLGQYKIARTLLGTLDELAEDDARREAEAKAVRGAVSMFSREAGDAEELLLAAAKAAARLKDDALAATVQYNLGLLFDGQRKPDEARAAFAKARSLAKKRGDLTLAARTLKALTDTELGAGEFAAAKARANESVEAADALPDGHDKAFLLMAAGRALEQIFRDAPEHDNALRLRAFALHRRAAEIAEKIGDRVALSFSLGYQGALYEFEKKHTEALALTQRALALAQQAQSPDALYRWQWQAARIMAKEGARDPAIEGYRRAVASLQSIRNDIAIRYGNMNARSSFREAVGAIYTELADLLLQRAVAEPDDGEQQKLLREARSTAELLKAAELEDYFQDDCVSLRKQLTKNIENIDERAAVVYIIPLADRTELLVSLPSKDGSAGRIARFKAEPNDDELTEIARQFRTNVEDRTTNAYLDQARQLFSWLIKPIEPLLIERKFDTLVFVPDGALRTVPMAALYDGERFLAEKYAVAVTPGLELMEAKRASEVVSRMLLSGLSQSVQGFSALPGVPPEIANISKLFDVKQTLKDKAFSREAVSDDLRSQNYSIVHLASHGVFDRDVRKSFVLTHDSQLTLDDLERLIRPGQLRDQPLELLALSACQTAAGDDRAALGLAGIAVKAGARSAFATLWFVNDRASARVVTDFYTQLKERPGRGKAHALQVAQVNLIKDPNFNHPCYWAPYLIIGNWL